MLESSGWWNWSITWGSGGPNRHANADEFRRRELLAAHHQHLPREERALELRERRFRQRVREVDVRSFQPEARAERLEFHRAPVESGSRSGPSMQAVPGPRDLPEARV